MPMRKFGVVLVLGLFLGVAGCKGQGGEMRTAAAGADEVKAVEPVYAAMKSIYDNFPDTSALQPKACGEQKWRQTMSWNSLVDIAGAPESEKVTGLGTLMSTADVGRIHRLPRPGSDMAGKGTTLSEAREQWDKLSHLGILKVGEAKAAVAHGGTTFDSGHLEGWLVVFDKTGGEPLCWWPVSAASSQKVRVTTKSGASAEEVRQAKEHAVRKDLGDHLRGALQDAGKKLDGKP
jgi:hypothetical protein